MDERELLLDSGAAGEEGTLIEFRYRGILLCGQWFPAGAHVPSPEAFLWGQPDDGAEN